MLWIVSTLCLDALYTDTQVASLALLKLLWMWWFQRHSEQSPAPVTEKAPKSTLSVITDCNFNWLQVELQFHYKLVIESNTFWRHSIQEGLINGLIPANIWMINHKDLRFIVTLKSDHEQTTIKICAGVVGARGDDVTLVCPVWSSLLSTNTPLSQLFHHLIWCFIDLFSLLLVLASQHGVNKKKSQGQQRTARGRIAEFSVCYRPRNDIDAVDHHAVSHHCSDVQVSVVNINVGSFQKSTNLCDHFHFHSSFALTFFFVCVGLAWLFFSF